MDNKSNKNLGTLLGNLFCTVVAVCAMAIVIALAVKLIIWMF